MGEEARVSFENPIVPPDREVNKNSEVKKRGGGILRKLGSGRTGETIRAMLLGASLMFPAKEAMSQTIYNPYDTTLIDQKLVQEQTLSASDQAALSKLLENLPKVVNLAKGEDPGRLFETNDMKIDYTDGHGGRNWLQVEIKHAKDIGQINDLKMQANQWFLSKGISQAGICDYPVQFYLGSDAKREWMRSGDETLINQVANECALRK